MLVRKRIRKVRNSRLGSLRHASDLRKPSIKRALKLPVSTKTSGPDWDCDFCSAPNNYNAAECSLCSTSKTAADTTSAIISDDFWLDSDKEVPPLPGEEQETGSLHIADQKPSADMKTSIDPTESGKEKLAKAPGSVMLTNTDVEDNVDRQIFNRGIDTRSAVSQPRLIDNGPSSDPWVMVMACVRGTVSKPYTVKARIRGHSFDSFACTCAYAQERKQPCKHLVAVLLVFIQAPQQFVRGELVDEAEEEPLPTPVKLKKEVSKASFEPPSLPHHSRSSAGHASTGRAKKPAQATTGQLKKKRAVPSFLVKMKEKEEQQKQEEEAKRTAKEKEEAERERLAALKQEAREQLKKKAAERVPENLRPLIVRKQKRPVFEEAKLGSEESSYSQAQEFRMTGRELLLHAKGVCEANGLEVKAKGHRKDLSVSEAHSGDLPKRKARKIAANPPSGNEEDDDDLDALLDDFFPGSSPQPKPSRAASWSPPGKSSSMDMGDGEPLEPSKLRAYEVIESLRPVRKQDSPFAEQEDDLAHMEDAVDDLLGSPSSPRIMRSQWSQEDFGGAQPTMDTDSDNDQRDSPVVTPSRRFLRRVNTLPTVASQPDQEPYSFQQQQPSMWAMDTQESDVDADAPESPSPEAQSAPALKKDDSFNSFGDKLLDDFF